MTQSQRAAVAVETAKFKERGRPKEKESFKDKNLSLTEVAEASGGGAEKLSGSYSGVTGQLSPSAAICAYNCPNDLGIALMITLDSKTVAHLAKRLAPELAERLATLPRPVDGDPDALLTEIAAAALLGLRPATLCSWRSRGHGPRFLRLGHKRRPAVRYRLGDLLTFRDARATDPGK